MNSIAAIERHGTDTAFDPSLRLVTTQPARKKPSWVRTDEDPIELRLGFRELVLIHRSLEAVRTLGLVERQHDLLTDTIQLIDVALEGAV
jgi:hypothetical protein